MADLHARLTAREELEASFESLIAQGIQASLDYIQVNVAPQIASLQQSISLAQDQINEIIIGGSAPNALKFGNQLPAYYATATALSDGLAGKVPNTRKVNGKELSGDVTLAKNDVGLGNVNNTADADKPISTEQAAALGKRIRVDAAQEFSAVQRGQARANMSAGVLAGHRNKLINGSFLVWQRGVGPFTVSGYTADRWRLEPGAGSSNSVQRADFIANDNLPFVDENCLRWTRTVAGSAPSYLLQKIEGARTLAGKTCTLTIWARSTVATKIRASLQQRFGTGGAPSATENYNGADEFILPGGGEDTRFNLVFTLGKLASKTFGANGNDALWVLLEWLHTDPNATITISHVSLVEGDATAEDDPFAPRHIGQEVALCQRYYATCYASARAYATGGSQFNNSTFFFPVNMRTTPSVGSTGGSNLNISSVSASLSGANAGRLEIVAAGTGDFYSLNRLVTADAEL